jgi:hypothetical protein
MVSPDGYDLPLKVSKSNLRAYRYENMKHKFLQVGVKVKVFWPTGDTAYAS